MPRREFPKAVKREALKRADGRCEGVLSETGERCPCFLTLGKYHFDHVVADQLGGRPELANCAVLCVPCHAEKTSRDAALIARAKRRADAHAGITGRKHYWPKGRSLRKGPPQHPTRLPTKIVCASSEIARRIEASRV